MKTLPCICFIFIMDFLSSHIQPIQGEKVVLCYVVGWAGRRIGPGKFTVLDVAEGDATNHCTHLVYAFMGLNETTDNIKYVDKTIDVDNSGNRMYQVSKLKVVKRSRPQMKVLASIGGWTEGGKKFSDMARQPDRRRAFIRSVLRFLRDYSLDGLDVCWQFPGERGGRPDEDKTNVITLFTELKEAFEPEGYLLTTHILAHRHIMDRFEIRAVSNVVDYICLATMEYNGPWRNKSSIMSPLKSNDYNNVEASVDYMLKKGANPRKLLLGLALYGQAFLLEEPLLWPNLQLRQASDYLGLPLNSQRTFPSPRTKQSGFLAYYEMCDYLLNFPGWTELWDSGSETPIGINGNKFVSYENKKSLLLKADLVKSKSLGGVMLWALDLDDFHGFCHGTKFPLLSAIGDYINGPQITSDGKDSKPNNKPNNAPSYNPPQQYQPKTTTAMTTKSYDIFRETSTTTKKYYRGNSGTESNNYHTTKRLPSNAPNVPIYSSRENPEVAESYPNVNREIIREATSAPKYDRGNSRTEPNNYYQTTKRIQSNTPDVPIYPSKENPEIAESYPNVNREIIREATSAPKYDRGNSRTEPNNYYQTTKRIQSNTPNVPIYPSNENPEIAESYPNVNREIIREATSAPKYDRGNSRTEPNNYYQTTKRVRTNTPNVPIYPSRENPEIAQSYPSGNREFNRETSTSPSQYDRGNFETEPNNYYQTTKRIPSNAAIYPSRENPEIAQSYPSVNRETNRERSTTPRNYNSGNFGTDPPNNYQTTRRIQSYTPNVPIYSSREDPGTAPSYPNRETSEVFQKSEPDPVLLCYIVSWAAYRPGLGRFTVPDAWNEHCTHIVYAFTHLNDTSYVISLASSQHRGEIMKLQALKVLNPKIKILASIGGYKQGSKRFSDMASTRETREIFVRSLLNFINEYNLDGIDICWQHPGLREGSPRDRETSVQLFREIKNAFLPYGYLLTVHILGHLYAVDSYDIRLVSDIVDYINFAAMEYHGSWENTVDIATPLTSSDSANVKFNLDYILSKGVPPSKLLLGLPFFGHVYAFREETQRGKYVGVYYDSLVASQWTNEPGLIAYNELCYEMSSPEESDHWTVSWDELSQTPVATKGRTFATYENERSLRLKTKLAVEKGLAGVMIWSLDMDDFRGLCYESQGKKFPLLAAVREGLSRGRRSGSGGGGTAVQRTTTTTQEPCTRVTKGSEYTIVSCEYGKK